MFVFQIKIETEKKEAVPCTLNVSQSSDNYRTTLRESLLFISPNAHQERENIPGPPPLVPTDSLLSFVKPDGGAVVSFVESLALNSVFCQ